MKECNINKIDKKIVERRSRIIHKEVCPIGPAVTDSDRTNLIFNHSLSIRNASFDNLTIQTPASISKIKTFQKKKYGSNN